MREAPKKIEVHFVENDIDPQDWANHRSRLFLRQLPMQCIKTWVSDFIVSLLTMTLSIKKPFKITIPYKSV